MMDFSWWNWPTAILSSMATVVLVDWIRDVFGKNIKGGDRWELKQE